MKNADAVFTAKSHMISHGIVYETARPDLIGLEARGLLEKRRQRQRFVWSPAKDFNLLLRRSE